MEDEDAPLPSEKLKRSGALFFSQYNCASQQMKTQKRLWLSRLEYQLISTASGPTTSEDDGQEELQDKPSTAETDGSQTYDYMQIPLAVS